MCSELISVRYRSPFGVGSLTVGETLIFGLSTRARCCLPDPGCLPALVLVPLG